jgi:transcription elongation factor GreA
LSEKRDRKLQDLLLGDKDLLLDLIDDASPEEMREVMRRILLATAFEELNKRSLLGRIIREYPDLQSMVSADSGDSEESLTVSWPSLEKRKAEYEDLVSKKIPENVKEISVARSYGDLRENFEYKAAKEMQRVLQRRRAEMERDLGRARGTDFSNTDTSKVGIGTQVTLRNVATASTESYHILGAWDGDPDRHIISYQTAIAQALIGSKPGDQATIPTESGESTVVVVSVELSSEIPVAVSQ